MGIFTVRELLKELHDSSPSLAYRHTYVDVDGMNAPSPCLCRVIGITMMADHESPRTPFEILLDRLPRSVAFTIVYDNNCHLHK